MAWEEPGGAVSCLLGERGKGAAGEGIAREVEESWHSGAQCPEPLAVSRMA
jgi:hypothetical protein